MRTDETTTIKICRVNQLLSLEEIGRETKATMAPVRMRLSQKPEVNAENGLVASNMVPVATTILMGSTDHSVIRPSRAIEIIKSARSAGRDAPVRTT